MPIQQGPQLPTSIKQVYEPFRIDLQGWWLILSDMHMPYHDERAVLSAIEEGKRQKIVGMILNGDSLDSHEISNFDRDPSKPRYVQEIKIGLQLMEYLRHSFPKAEIIYKTGNHEERLDRYIMQRAPALFGLEEVELFTLLKLDDFDIPYVGEKRIIHLGKLHVLHGHEFTDRQMSSPVNPARGLFMRSKGNAICGHHHQTSEHHEPTISGKQQGCWSTGCLCQLNPPYRPLNKWNSGFALVKVDAGGSFHVRNLKIIDGKVT